MKKIVDELKYKNTNFDLLASFNESLKDEKFKNLISKLNLTYEELANYTTLLEDCSIEYNNCLNCKSIMECKNKIKGHAYLPEVEDKKLKFGYKICKKEAKIEKETRYLENIYCYDIPKSIKEAKIKEIIAPPDDKSRFETIKWINNFIKKYPTNKNQKGLYLNGSFGSGKTYLLSAMFNELAKQGFKSSIIFWPEYLSYLKSLFGQEDYHKKIDQIKRTPLLLIDDIGAETTTSWSRDEILCPIVQYRMQESLPTFFTSNLDLKNLESHLSISRNGVEEIKSRRIIERISQLTEKQELISKNYRNI